MIEIDVFTEEARAYMRPWLFPIAKSLYEMAREQEDPIGSSSIARLANEQECFALSTADQLRQMKTQLLSSPHAGTYLHFFRQYFEEQGIAIEGF